MTFKGFINCLVKFFWIYLITTIVCGAVAFYINYYQLQNVYESTATVWIVKSVEEKGESIYNAVMANTNLTKDYKELIKQETVLKKVKSDLEATNPWIKDMSLKSIAKSTYVKNISDTRIIEISVQNTDPAKTAILANKIAEVLKEVTADIMKIDNITIVNYGEVPTEPVYPKRLKSTFLASFAGLFGGIALVYLIALYRKK